METSDNLRERMSEHIDPDVASCVQCRWIQQLSGQPCKRVHSDLSREWNRCIPYFDSLNWIETMKLPIEEALKTGKIVEGAICYTGDITSPNETKYTLDYYVKMAKRTGVIRMPFCCDQGYGRTSEAAGSKRTDQHTEERTSCTITFAYTRFYRKWCKYCYDGSRSGVDIVDWQLSLCHH